MTLEEEETMRARSVSDGWMEKPPFPATRYRAEEKSLCVVRNFSPPIKMRHMVIWVASCH